MFDARLINFFYDCKKVRFVFVNDDDIDFYMDDVQKIEIFNNFLTIISRNGNMISANMNNVTKIMYYN